MKSVARKAARRAVWALADARDRVLRPADIVPPRYLANWAGGVRDFHIVGRNWLERFRTFAGLEPEESVLDIGCGVGRIALALTGYTTGRYEGFDVLRPAIDWCRGSITPRYPNFRFTHADVWNPMYNPDGKVCGDDFQFPYTDSAFDFAFATSVFTHMLTGEMSQYLVELRRVLASGGRAMVTFYLLDTDTHRAMQDGSSKHSFPHQRDGCYVSDPANPTAAVAYDLHDVREAVHRAGLEIATVSLGSWRGTASSHGQDLLVVRRS